MRLTLASRKQTRIGHAGQQREEPFRGGETQPPPCAPRHTSPRPVLAQPAPAGPHWPQRPSLTSFPLLGPPPAAVRRPSSRPAQPVRARPPRLPAPAASSSRSRPPASARSRPGFCSRSAPRAAAVPPPPGQRCAAPAAAGARRLRPRPPPLPPAACLPGAFFPPPHSSAASPGPPLPRPGRGAGG